MLQVATITATEVPSYHFDPHPAIHIILGYQWIKMTTWNLTETATGSIQGLPGKWVFFFPDILQHSYKIHPSSSQQKNVVFR